MWLFQKLQEKYDFNPPPAKHASVHSPKKLIEVNIPLDAINAACIREKAIRHGHPSTMHLWWARRPLAAARAVLFASLVNDPGYVNKDFRHGVNKEEAQKKRETLWKIIEDLVVWENSNNPEVLKRAHDAIVESWQETCRYNKNHPQAAELFNPNKLPAFHDPFAGGGAIPLEAMRLGLESFASDLNPVPVLINKAMIEIPPKFRNKKPSGPMPDGETENLAEDIGNQGLAEDIRRYGLWMLKEARKKIGQYYQEVEITEALAKDRDDLKGFVGRKYPVIAWIWARTVKSPNPMFNDIDVPLVSTFELSKNAGQETYIDPVIHGNSYSFVVRRGKCPDKLKNGTKRGRGANFECLISGSPITADYIKNAGMNHQMGTRLMATVIDGPKGRIYLSPTLQPKIQDDLITWIPETVLAQDPRALWTVSYGLARFCDLFSQRQLLALTTFSNLIHNSDDVASTVVYRATKDAIAAGMSNDNIPLAQGGTGAKAYGEAIGLYMAFVVDKCADYLSTICTWNINRSGLRNTFARQGIPMSWDFAEANPFGNSIGSWSNHLDNIVKVIRNLPILSEGKVFQAAAQSQMISHGKVISTDPPYYDNVGYADLSDFFYVWLRHNVSEIFPDICSTLATPKREELIASQYRQGSKLKAEDFFLSGMTDVMKRLGELSHSAFPITIYYAFKQSETKEDGTTNTGWVTFLEAVLKAGFQITGTWPMRTERNGRTVGIGANALASSIILVCRKRPETAPSISRKQFQRELKVRLTEALDDMTSGGSQRAIAPVDMSQAIIGPGMEVFSQYSEVLSADGSKLSVSDALKMINGFLDEDAFDQATQFAMQWFKTVHWDAGEFGVADGLARAKGTSVARLEASGILTSGKGKVQLIHWKNLPSDWDPEKDDDIPQWEACHHMIKVLQEDGSEGAAKLLAALRDRSTENLNIALFCSAMYTFCERAGRPDDAIVYNELSQALPDIEQQADGFRKQKPEQIDLF